MAYLDWYLHLNESSRERGYDLGLLICPDSQIVVREIIPRAVEIACKNARKQTRRSGVGLHWKIHFSDPQLYQIAILEASQGHARTCGSAPNRLIWYIAFLCLCTLQRNSFYVAVGFERILSAGSARQILELYEWLYYHFFPDNPPIGRDEKSANDICGSLHEQIYVEFKEIFQTNGQRLVFDKVPKSSGGMNGDICRILDKMIPWETEHLSNANQHHRSSHKRTIAEMSLAHVCIDQERCLEEVKRNNQQISGCFDSWNIPVPNNVEPAEPAMKEMPPWDDVKEEIMKEIHWSEEKSKRGWGGIFEVVVDGEIVEIIAEEGTKDVSLPSSARYVEIREAESGRMAANCHLMDPDDLPETGWKASVELTRTRRVSFEFLPARLAAGHSSILMKIGIDAKQNWATSLGNWTKQIFHSYAGSGRAKSAALAGAVLSLAIAVSAGFIVLSREASRQRVLVSDLQKQNSDLRSQVSEITALKEEIAKLREAAVQPDSHSRISEAVNDGSLVVALDAKGDLAGAESIPEEFHQMIKAALATGRVAASQLRLSRNGPGLMGTDARSEAFTLISPVGIVIESDRPTFRWKPLNGATSYTVSVSDSDYDEVASGTSLSETKWTIDRRLKRGDVYFWQVVALKDGKEIKSPGAPGIMAQFQVLTQRNADELAKARKNVPSSHLVMGLLYAKAGRLETAERELRMLAAANPKSSAAQGLLRSIQAQRRRATR